MLSLCKCYTVTKVTGEYLLFVNETGKFLPSLETVNTHVEYIGRSIYHPPDSPEVPLEVKALNYLHNDRKFVDVATNVTYQPTYNS